MRKILPILAVVAIAATPVFAQLSAGDLVINEIAAANDGTDLREFVELYNTTGGDIDLSATPVSLEMINGSNGLIYDTYLLNSGTITAADPYYVVGATPVANVDLDVGAISGLLQNGDPDAVIVRDVTSTNVVDALAYFCSYAGGTGTADLGLLGVDAVEGDGSGAGSADGGPGAFTVQLGLAQTDPVVDIALGRVPDGADTDDNQLDFDNLLLGTTPGASNVAAYAATAAAEDFSVAGGVVNSWGASFTPILFETAGTAVPAAIPNSPDATSPTEWGSHKDNTGGGDEVILLDVLAADYTVRGYFYCGAGTSSLVSPETEVGGLMARKDGSSFENNLSGSYDVTTPISTYGNSWYAIETDYRTGDTIAYEASNGVRGAALGTVNIASPGWHEFGIRCEGGLVEFGVDGVQLALLTGEPIRPGYVGIGYREIDSAGTGTVRNNFDGVVVTAATPVPVELSIFSTN